MNWLDRARSEMRKSAPQPTANSAEGNPTAVMAVPYPAIWAETRALRDTESTAHFRADWTLLELLADWDERAAIMVDDGMSQADAEREAWNLGIYRSDRLH